MHTHFLIIIKWKIRPFYFDNGIFVHIFVAKIPTKIKYKPKTVLKMETKNFKSEEIKDLKVEAIARKYKCSNTYVRDILKGNKVENPIKVGPSNPIQSLQSFLLKLVP